MNLDSLSLDEQEQYLRMELARRANACLELLDRHKNFAYTRSKFQAPADNVNSKPPSVLPSNDPTQFYPPLSAALSIARFFKTSTDRRVSSLSSDAGFMDRLDVALQAGIDKTNKVFKCPFGLAVLLSSLLCQMAVENSAVKLDVLTNNTDVLRAVTVPWALVPETTTRTILEASVPLTTQSDTGIRTDGSPFQLLQQLTGLGTFKPYYLLNSGVIHDLIDLGSSPTLLAATTGVSAPATNAALTGHVLAAQLLERQFTFSDGDVIESQVKAVSIKPLKLNDVQFSVLAGRFDANRVVPQLGVSTSALGQDVLSSLNDNSDALGYIKWALALEATAFKAEPSQLVVTPGSSVYSLVNQLISEDLADLPVYAIHCSKLLAKLNGEAPTSPVRKSIATALNEQLALVGSIFATLGRFVGAEQHQVDQRALVKLLINTVNSLLTAIEIQLEAPKPARVLVALTKSFASLFLSIGASCDPEWDLNSVSLLEKLAVDQGSKGNPDSTQKTDFQLDAEACITNVILTIIKSAWFSANMGTVIPVNLINTLLQAGKLASTAASSGEKVQEQAVAPQQQQQQQQQQQEQQQQLVQWFMEQRIVIGNTYNQLQAATALYATKYDVVQSVTGVLAALETLAAETKDAAAAAEIPHSTALVKAAKFELEQVTQPYIQLSQTYQYLSEQYQAYARYYPDIEAYAARGYVNVNAAPQQAAPQAAPVAAVPDYGYANPYGYSAPQPAPQQATQQIAPQTSTVAAGDYGYYNTSSYGHAAPQHVNSDQAAAQFTNLRTDPQTGVYNVPAQAPASNDLTSYPLHNASAPAPVAAAADLATASPSIFNAQSQSTVLAPQQTTVPVLRVEVQPEAAQAGAPLASTEEGIKMMQQDKDDDTQMAE